MFYCSSKGRGDKSIEISEVFYNPATEKISTILNGLNLMKSFSGVKQQNLIHSFKTTQI